MSEFTKGMRAQARQTIRTATRIIEPGDTGSVLEVYSWGARVYGVRVYFERLDATLTVAPGEIEPFEHPGVEDVRRAYGLTPHRQAMIATDSTAPSPPRAAGGHHG